VGAMSKLIKSQLWDRMSRCDISFAVRQVAYSRNAFALDKNILLRDGLP
jgi:hypothetical protein